MKDTQVENKKSLLSTIKNALKNSILADIFFNANSGRVVSDEDLENATPDSLAQAANISAKEAEEYMKAFEEANKKLAKQEDIITKLPKDKKDDNPFHVDESELSEPTAVVHKESKGIENERDEF